MDDHARPPYLHVDVRQERSSGRGCLLSLLAFVVLAVAASFLISLLDSINWQVIFGQRWSNSSISWTLLTIIMGIVVFFAAIYLHSGWWTALSTVPFFALTVLLAFLSSGDLDDFFGNEWVFMLGTTILNLLAALLGFRYSERLREQRISRTRKPPDPMLEW